MPNFKRYENLLISLFFLFILSGCDGLIGKATHISEDTQIVTMEGEPHFIANSPEVAPLWDNYENTTLAQLTEKSQEGDSEAIFLLALIQFGHTTGFEQEPEHARGLNMLQEAWRLGVVDAGYSLFTVYYKGIGIRKNIPLSLAYLEASAEKGYIQSQKDLAYAYRGTIDGPYPRGIVEEDIERARFWFTKAAEQGDAESATQLAGIYHKGQGVPQNDRAAFEWLKRAETMPFDGDLSHSGLAICYEQGIGTEIDLVQAYKYYDLQGSAGVPDKRRLEARMMPEQVQQAIALSRAWQEEHRTFVPSYYGLEHQPDGSYK